MCGVPARPAPFSLGRRERFNTASVGSRRSLGLVQRATARKKNWSIFYASDRGGFESDRVGQPQIVLRLSTPDYALLRMQAALIAAHSPGDCTTR